MYYFYVRKLKFYAYNMRYTKKELKEAEDFNKSIYKIKKSSIKGAGKGLYSKIHIHKGTVLDEYR